MEMVCYLIRYGFGKNELYDLLLIHDISVMGTSWFGGWNM